MADFDLVKFLKENKMTRNSRLLAEDENKFHATRLINPNDFAPFPSPLVIL
jgi:hypothetical protein